MCPLCPPFTLGIKINLSLLYHQTLAQNKSSIAIKIIKSYPYTWKRIIRIKIVDTGGTVVQGYFIIACSQPRYSTVPHSSYQLPVPAHQHICNSNRKVVELHLKPLLPFPQSPLIKQDARNN